MLDVDDAEAALSAPPLVPGGRPWLLLGRDLMPKAPETSPQVFGEDRTQGSVSGAAALKSVELALATERSRRVQLESDLERMKSANRKHSAHAAQMDEDIMLGRQQAAELSGMHQEVDRLRSDLATATKQLSELRKKLRGVRKQEATLERMFLDPEDDFAFQLNHTWAQQVPAADKGRLALGAYRVGEDFLTSLREQPPEKQKKAYKAIVDLLVNDPARLSARDAHQFRSNASGGSPARTRNNGRDHFWRLSIEQNVAAARRLHYWKCADGVIELSSVTVHDGAES